MRICLSAPNTLGYPAGGHVWVFINWALGLQSLGHEVIWFDVVENKYPRERVPGLTRTMLDRLQPFGLDKQVVLCGHNGERHECEFPLRELDEATSCDLLINLRYNLPRGILNAFKHTTMIDIDPGQFQKAVEWGTYDVGEHGSYFTVGEWTNYRHLSNVSDLGKNWTHIPPPVALDAWPVTPAPPDAAMTTVSGWYMAGQWMSEEKDVWYDNSKQAAFQMVIDIPKESPVPLELCIDTIGYPDELGLLHSKGWRTHLSTTVDDPQIYRRYVQNSLGEFSCAKPAYVRMNSGWLSDRTACYLASGKPVVIQKTGPSEFLPDANGCYRFTDYASALSSLQAMAKDYPAACKAARGLAEEFLDAKKVLPKVLDIAMNA